MTGTGIAQENFTPRMDGRFYGTIPRDQPGSEAIRRMQTGDWLLNYLAQEITKPWVQEFVLAMQIRGIKGIECGFPWPHGETFVGDPRDQVLVFTSKGEFHIAEAETGALSEWKIPFLKRTRLDDTNVATVLDHVCGIFPENKTPADVIMNALLIEARRLGITVPSE